MKILITGSNGLLGQKIVHQLKKENISYLATSKGENRISSVDVEFLSLDITNKDEIEKVFNDFQPNAVINTAALTNVDLCETERDLCRSLNVDAVEFLLESCKVYNTHLIHLSTDFIFDGQQGNYKEEDQPNPLSFYGQSKLDSELILKNSSYTNWSIVRTIIVYGIAEKMSRTNIVLWAKSALEKGDPLKIVNDQYRAPTLAEDLASACVTIAKKNKKGVYHISGSEYMSIFDLVSNVANYFELRTDIESVPSSYFGTAANRPPKTGFDLTKSINELNYSPRTLKQGLAVLDQQLKNL